MKLQIKVKRLNTLNALPKVIDKGEWVDLRCSETTIMKAPRADTLKRVTKDGEMEAYRKVSFDLQYIPLGIAMKLPSGYEAHILPRSSTAKGFGILLANSQGIIDESYSGNTDEWKFPAIALRDTAIKGPDADENGNLTSGERICQFRIMLSQKATIWQKLKWLFTSGIEFVEVGDLGDNPRGGFGSTGKN